ncbi:large ribosomal subunit protein uL4c isoform X3 [Cryptomeria japonica]|uniref:large ribosomal subunit protein uL4c isoform X3 n=1 Tax=Cryptomeria japonica TaxID=3369 RepID=UPI0025ACD6C4|nr:large ribosomal subunit protein uL4c isoform X3 [Cryptomeria japonica]
MAKCLSFSTSTFFCPPSISLQRPPSQSCSTLHQWSLENQKKRSLTLSISAEAVTIPVITFDGEKAGTASLDIKTARPETARAVVHRGVVTELQNRRRGTASTLTRGEVRGGGRKPYKQKGTGNARRGSQRTPLRPGGGIIFGPKPKDWSIKINKKEKRLAISTALASAAVDSVVIDSFTEKFDTPKTKNFVAALKKWGVQPSEDHALIFTTELSENVRLSSRNIGSLKILTPRTLNLYDILRADKLIFTKDGVEYLNKMYGLNSAIREEDEEKGEEEGKEEEQQYEEEESSETPETAQ